MSRARSLPISDRFNLPLDYISDTNLVLGTKGSGKSYFGMKLIEGMIAAGAQVAIIDVTGVWWGLTSRADGKAPGLGLYIFGGNHAHAPLEPSAGELLARWTVESGQSLILDASLMRKGEMHRFYADYLENLYRLKASHRESMHLMMDEANRLAPMRPGKDQTRVLGAAEDIVLQGRSRGLGLTMLTQRPAILHNDLRSQSQAIVALRIPGPHDQKAVKDWLDIHATEEHRDLIMANLAKLHHEGFYFTTTGGIEDPVRFTIGERWTFDSSYTPKPGERLRAVKARSEVDLEKLTGEIRQTAEAAEANKPEKLKAKIRELERALNEQRNAKDGFKMAFAKAVAAKPPKRIEVPILPAKDMERLDKTINRLAESHDRLSKALAQAISDERELTQGVSETIERIGAKMKAPFVAPIGGDYDPRRDMQEVLALRKNSTGKQADLTIGPAAGKIVGQHAATVIIDDPGTSNGDDKPSKMDRAFLTALYQCGGTLTRPQLLTHTAYKKSGNTISSMSKMIRLGWVEKLSGKGGGLSITPKGIEAMGTIEPLAQGGERRARIVDADHPQADRKLDKMDRAFMRVAFDRYPNAISRAEMLEANGYKKSGNTIGSFARLIRMGWLVAGMGTVRAADMFYTNEERERLGVHP